MKKTIQVAWSRYRCQIGTITAILMILTGCSHPQSESNPASTAAPAPAQNSLYLESADEKPTDYKSEPTTGLSTLQVKELQPLQDAEVPTPIIVIDDQQISIVQDSFCWRGIGCADYIGGPMMMDGHPIPQIEAAAIVHILYPYSVQPDKVYINQYQTGRSSDPHEIQSNSEYAIVPVQQTIASYDIDGKPVQVYQFLAPAEPGIYYYSIAAGWMSEDGLYSEGDASSFMAFEVKPKNEQPSSQ